MTSPVISFRRESGPRHSVVITALRSSNGAAAENIRLALLEEVVILMDYKLACEYRDVALRPEHLAVAGKTREDTILLLDMLEAVAEPAEIVDLSAAAFARCQR